MAHPQLCFAALAAVCLAAPAWAEPGTHDDARALAAEIDQFIAAQWAANHVTPAPLTDEGAFLRRASLDVIGRIPSVSERNVILDKPSES